MEALRRELQGLQQVIRDTEEREKELWQQAAINEARLLHEKAQSEAVLLQLTEELEKMNRRLVKDNRERAKNAKKMGPVDATSPEAVEAAMQANREQLRQVQEQIEVMRQRVADCEAEAAIAAEAADAARARELELTNAHRDDEASLTALKRELAAVLAEEQAKRQHSAEWRVKIEAEEQQRLAPALQRKIEAETSLMAVLEEIDRLRRRERRRAQKNKQKDSEKLISTFDVSLGDENADEPSSEKEQAKSTPPKRPNAPSKAPLPRAPVKARRTPSTLLRRIEGSAEN